ncbi:MAG: AraC family transcriptional regulator [Bacillota bacterium]|nr:AraC family transcriptional regulator [Bacillota bacterium]
MGYLRGLSEGLGINDDTKEGKIIRQLISFLDDIVESVQSMQEDYDELFSYVEAIDEDLTDLENGFFEDEDEDEDEDDDDEDDEDDEDDDDYDVSFTVECPECRQEVAIDEDILEDEESLEVLCPNCGRVVFINDEEWEEELEESGEEDK